jgi:hypothetical protein
MEYFCQILVKLWFIYGLDLISKFLFYLLYEAMQYLMLLKISIILRY